MSDEFETISARRSGDIEAMRAKYRRHRDTLMTLVAEAPTELIAADYRRVIADIDIALAKLDQIDGTLPRAAAAAPPPPPPQAPRVNTQPGMRPLVTTTAVDGDAHITEGSDARSRLLLIVGAAVLALAAIGWLIYKASAGPERPAVVEEEPTATATTATVTEEEPAATPARAARLLTVTPDTNDYGIVRKGTRATRQYEIVNNSDEPISVAVARSTCRCLYYEHAPVVPPKAKESLTVTIDGAKAKPGPLLESIRVSAKSDASVVTTFDVTATVR
jgi:Protein of unknown function (DUF1573)